MDKKLIIAHRGASRLARENTLEAFQKAIDLGADMAELDVRKTKDNILVVHHDPSVNKQLISNLNWGQVNKLKPEVPTFEQVLQLAAGKIKLDVEFKEKGYEREVLDLTLKYLNPEQFVITSFKGCVVLSCKNQYSQIKAGLLLEPLLWTIYNSTRYFDFSYFTDSFSCRKEAITASDFLSVSEGLYDKGIMAKEGLYKKLCMIYTVDKDEKIKQYLSKPNVWGVISNYPDIALKIRDGGILK